MNTKLGVRGKVKHCQKSKAVLNLHKLKDLQL